MLTTIKALLNGAIPMEAASIPKLNGKLLYYSFVAGSQRVLQHQNLLNEMNVFPVRDKDTGSNLASTIGAIIQTVHPDRSYKKTIARMAEAALIGARGNSGVIFAQFLHGIARETINKPAVTLHEFAMSVRKALPHVYSAISNPVEGTMLTVMHDWSNFLWNKKESGHDFKQVLMDSVSILEKSLSETTGRLKVLRQYGLVDAGAKGFVLFIKGIIDFVRIGNLRALKFKETAVTLVHAEENTEQTSEFRFCTEAIIKELQTGLGSLKETLSTHGDSVVVAGSDRLCRMHVHTNHPAELFHLLKDTGTITMQKVDDMHRQQEMAEKRKWNIALVTDSTCDLDRDLIDHYQINVIPLNLYFGENHYLDKLTMQPDQFYDRLSSSPEFPKTAQINEHAFTNLYSRLASYYDAVISIHLTSQFSGTYANAVKAARRVQNEFNKPIYVIDSKNLSGALGLLVLKAARLIADGQTAESIFNTVQQDVNNAKIFVSVRNLQSMIRGGRVSKPAGLIANLLRLNPVISMDEAGKSTLFGKTFSQRASLKKIFRHIAGMAQERKIWNYIVLHAHNPEGAATAHLKMAEISGKQATSVIDISPAIGMHAGAGALSVAVLLEDQHSDPER